VNQAQRIIEKFGGARSLARALDKLGDPNVKRDPSVVFRWSYSKAKGGTGGRIPSTILDAVQAAARLEGILITPLDLYGDTMP
jgi:hypothetical protein